VPTHPVNPGGPVKLAGLMLYIASTDWAAPSRWRFEMASRLLRRQVMSLTDAAAARVRELTEAAGKPIAGLRVGVKNGGCAGMSYTMELAETASPLDEVVEDKGVKLLIDPKAVLFLLGAQMDFKVDRLSATFAFSNPNETSACGCGESVAITPANPEALNAPA
jgi:iron-sulfur cluster assembly protein